jgi:hypothetical protein
MSRICKLCGSEKQLMHSHILPAFYIRSLEAWRKKGPHGEAKPHSLVISTKRDFRDGWMQRGYWEKQLGWKEYLLCNDCEKRFQAHEGKIRAFLYGSAPPPLRKQTLGMSITPSAPLPPHVRPDILDIRGVAVDYRALKLFQMSLLWRASVARGEYFLNVDLGQRHENILRQFLLNDDPGTENDYPCVMYDLQSEQFQFENYRERPTSARDCDGQGQRTYRMILGGYAFLYSVSAHPSSHMCLNFCAKPTGKMFLLVVNGELFLERCVMRLRRAGKL